MKFVYRQSQRSEMRRGKKRVGMKESRLGVCVPLLLHVKSGLECRWSSLTTLVWPLHSSGKNERATTHELPTSNDLHSLYRPCTFQWEARVAVCIYGYSCLQSHFLHTSSNCLLFHTTKFSLFGLHPSCDAVAIQIAQIVCSICVRNASREDQDLFQPSR